MLKRVFLFLIIIVFLNIFVRVDDFIVNIYRIPANAEYDGKFQFRPANEIIPDHGELAVLPQFDLANEMNVCYSVESRLMSNGLAGELAKPIALKQVYLPTNPVCSDNQNVQFDSWDYPPLTIIISRSPMAAYPEFPMFKEDPYEIVESLNTYKIYVRPVSVTRTDSHLCIYGSFKVGDLYVFTRSGYMSVLSEQSKIDLVKNMDMITQLIESKS